MAGDDPSTKDRPEKPEGADSPPGDERAPTAADLPEEESIAVTTLEDVEPPDIEAISAEMRAHKPLDRPSVEPAEEKGEGEKPAEKPAEDAPGEEKAATDEKPAEKTADEKPAETPEDDKPAEKPEDDRPAETPSDDKPADPPAEEKPAKKKPAKKPAKKKAKKPAREYPELPRAVLKSSPHNMGTDSVKKIMFTVVLAMVPACAAAVWFFGWRAAAVIAGCSVGCIALEFGILRLRMSTERAWKAAIDGSALITGILLALNLPVSSPWWLVLVGCIVAMVLGKHSFGGLGQNPFNPALVARVFLLLSFPAQMTSWDAPIDRFALAAAEAVTEADTGASPLGVITEGVRPATQDDPGVTVTAALAEADVDLWKLSIGNVKGSLGEVSVIALLLGAILMLVRRVITWHIPVAYIGTVAAVTGLMYVIDPELYANPLFHIVSGGLILGAFFMATDMVTSPVTARGMLIFGIGCGVITAVIRLFGAFPEGVSFAILIMNGFVPLIERKTRPRKFGEKKASKEGKADG